MDEIKEYDGEKFIAIGDGFYTNVHGMVYRDLKECNHELNVSWHMISENNTRELIAKQVEKLKELL